MSKKIVLGLSAVIAAWFFLPYHASAVTPTKFWISVTPKLPNKTDTVKSVRLDTGVTRTAFTLPLQGTFLPSALGGMRMVYHRDDDLYVRNLATNKEKLFLQFTDCVGDSDLSSCTISTSGLSATGRYLPYQYKGMFLYDFTTGKRTKLSKYWQGVSQSEKYLYINSSSANQPGVDILKLRRITSGATRTITLKPTSGYIGNVEISPTDLYVLWTTGGSTDSNTGITTPTKLNLTRFSDGKRLTTLTVQGAPNAQVWLSATTFVAVQTTNVNADSPTYRVYLVSIANEKMKANLMYTTSTRTVQDFRRIDNTHLLVLEKKGTNVIFSSISTTGHRRVIKTMSNPNEDWIQLIGLST